MSSLYFVFMKENLQVILCMFFPTKITETNEIYSIPHIGPEH